MINDPGKHRVNGLNELVSLRAGLWPRSCLTGVSRSQAPSPFLGRGEAELAGRLSDARAGIAVGLPLPNGERVGVRGPTTLNRLITLTRRAVRADLFPPGRGEVRNRGNRT